MQAPRRRRPYPSRGIICVQGEQMRTVPEAEMLDALYEETLAFANRVDHGEAELSHAPVTIAPPDPLPKGEF